MAVATDPKSWTHHRAKVAALSRDRDPEDPELVDARRDLKEARLAEHIARVVDEAPPLTAEQRDRLAVILRGGDARPLTAPAAAAAAGRSR